MTTPFGVVVNPRAGIPTTADLRALGVSWVRSIIYTVGDIGALRLVIPDDINLCVMLNNECAEVGWDWSGWEAALHALVTQYAGRVQAVECGNELDRFWAMNANDVPPSFGADLVRRANAILAPAGINTLLSSVAGPKWQEWMQQASDLCRDQMNGAAFHPYGQRPDGFKQPGWGFGDLRAAIGRAYEISQRPVWLTEYGVKLSDAGGTDGQAEYAKTAVQTIDALSEQVVPMACYFALSDQVGTAAEQGADAFGLIGASGNYRPAFGEYGGAILAAAAPAPPAPPAPTPAPPAPTPEPGPALAPLDQAYAALWRAVMPELPINPDAAFYRSWQANPDAMGSPVSAEIPDADGSVLQSFARGIWRWREGNDLERVA